MLPTQSQPLPKVLRGNDPKGNQYFYFNEMKKKVYFRMHTGAKSTIDRVATDNDKSHYPDAWDDFQRLHNEPTNDMPTGGERHRDKQANNHRRKS